MIFILLRTVQLNAIWDGNLEVISKLHLCSGRVMFKHLLGNNIVPRKLHNKTKIRNRLVHSVHFYLDRD